MGCTPRPSSPAPLRPPGQHHLPPAAGARTEVGGLHSLAGGPLSRKPGQGTAAPSADKALETKVAEQLPEGEGRLSHPHGGQRWRP